MALPDLELRVSRLPSGNSDLLSKSPNPLSFWIPGLRAQFSNIPQCHAEQLLSGQQRTKKYQSRCTLHREHCASSSPLRVCLPVLAPVLMTYGHHHAWAEVMLSSLFLLSLGALPPSWLPFVSLDTIDPIYLSHFPPR